MSTLEEKQLAEHMKQIRIKEKEHVAQALAQASGLPYVFLEKIPISSDALLMVPEEKARQTKAICFLKTLRELYLGVTDPFSPGVKELVASLTVSHHLTPTLYLISEHSLECALKLYSQIPQIKAHITGLAIAEEDLHIAMQGLETFEHVKEKIHSSSVTEILNVLTAAAVKFRASDIHCEAEEKRAVVRYRIDGMLHDIAELPLETWPRLVSRIKLLAGLKINIANKPQDGRFTIVMAADRIEVRVSVIPTAHGESLVMRILRTAVEKIPFDELGLRGQALAALKAQISRPAGMILNSGPTGSGKTTTLYAILHTLNSPEVKIITVEDPIEYQIVGISQSQVNADAGYDFAGALRSIVRHDPDIIMVGEIRDPETSGIAVQAALTGHLVLSTVHTNSAAATIPRLVSLETKSFLIAPALNCIIAQRLVRKVCLACKTEDTVSPETKNKVKEMLGALWPEKVQFVKGKGCKECMGFGYKDRIGIFEVIEMNDELKSYILEAQENASEYEILSRAKKHGMITMVQDGLLKAVEGITTVEEVFRVTE